MEISKIMKLETEINMAFELGFKYFAIKVEMDGFPEDEVIINPIENAVEKIEYYKNTYNEDLTHKHAKGIRIVDSTFGDTYDEIAWDFSLEINFDEPYIVEWNKDDKDDKGDKGEE